MEFVGIILNVFNDFNDGFFQIYSW